jgi:hypothetical protein
MAPTSKLLIFVSVSFAFISAFLTFVTFLTFRTVVIVILATFLAALAAFTLSFFATFALVLLVFFDRLRFCGFRSFAFFRRRFATAAARRRLTTTHVRGATSLHWWHVAKTRCYKTPSWHHTGLIPGDKLIATMTFHAVASFGGWCGRRARAAAGTFRNACFLLVERHFSGFWTSFNSLIKFRWDVGDLPAAIISALMLMISV